MAAAVEAPMFQQAAGESEHSSDAREWATSASNNARRRAQNRVAQRNHREKTKRRIEDLEAQLSMCLNPQTFQMSNNTPAKPQDQQTDQPASKSPTNSSLQSANSSELDAWMMNSGFGNDQPHSASQGNATSPKAFNGECSAYSIPQTGASPIELVNRDFSDISMFQHPQAPQPMEGIDTTNWVDFASLLTPPASDISQPCPPAQSNPAAFPQTMAPDPMIFPALDMHFPLYSADPIPGPEIPVAQMVPQQVAEVPSRSGSNASDPTVLTPHDRQEHILSSARAAGYSSFDAAVVDYYTGYYDEGSSVHEAQKASRSTRLRGVLGSLSRSAQRWPSSDVQGYHNEVRRAAEMLCMTDMAKLADTGAPDHCSKSSPMSRKDSGVSGCSDGSEKGLHAAFQDKAPNVWALLSQMTRQSEGDARETSSPVTCALLLLAWARDTHDLETPRMKSLLRLIQDSVPFGE